MRDAEGGGVVDFMGDFPAFLEGGVMEDISWDRRKVREGVVVFEDVDTFNGARVIGDVGQAWRLRGRSDNVPVGESEFLGALALDVLRGVGGENSCKSSSTTSSLKE